MTAIIILILAGLILLFLETILPGGIAGLVGVGCMVASIYLAYADFGVSTGNFVLAVNLGLLVLSILAWFKYFPTSKIAQIFVSKSTVGGMDYTYSTLEGKDGVILAACRPSGVAEIEGNRFDVVAESGYIEKDTKVKVIEVEGNRIVVRSKDL